jgi:ketosteroid isomerase-like protein
MLVAIGAQRPAPPAAEERSIPWRCPAFASELFFAKRARVTLDRGPGCRVPKFEGVQMERRTSRRTWIAICAAGAALGWACATPGTEGGLTDEERAGIEREILALGDQLDRAYRESDLETYWSFYADDLTQIWNTGYVSLEQYKRDWTALVAGGGGVVDTRSEDVRVHISPTGDSAVVTYFTVARYRGANGNESESRFYETDVWFRRDGRWQIVHYHFSSAADAITGAPEEVGGE